jgi:NitT/TauT family transport system substrate-binding protein
MLPPSRSLLLAAAAASVIALSACGETADGESEGSSSKSTTVKVGVVPVTTVAPLYLGVEKGFFEDEGLTVEPEAVSTSPAIIAGVTSGELQFGFSATASIMQAHARGVPVSVVVGGSYSPQSEPGTSLIAAKGSGIASVADLAGKTVAVNELQGQSELGIRAVADRAGVPQDKLKFIALPFPEMTAALDGGRADAAGMVQPFGTTAEEGGHVAIVDDYYAEMHPALTVTSWFAANRYVAENSDVVERFSAAMSRSMEYAMEHPEELQEVIPEYTKIPLEGARALPLAATSPQVTQETIQLQAELLARFGMLEGEVDLDKYVADPVRDTIVD